MVLTCMCAKQRDKPCMQTRGLHVLLSEVGTGPRGIRRQLGAVCM